MNPTSAGYDGGVDAVANGEAGPTYGFDVDDNNQPGGASGSWETNPINPSSPNTFWPSFPGLPGWAPYAVGAVLAVIVVVAFKEFT
jgi:hypothetical protein